MLPSFPEAQKTTNEAWQKQMFDAMNQSFPLSLHPPVQQIVEGKTSDFQRDDRQIRRIDLKKHQATMHLDTKSGKGATIDHLFKIAREAGASLGKQKWKLIEEMVSEAVSETGQEIKISDRQLTQDDILRMMDMGVEDFDESGNSTRQLVCGAELLEKLKRCEEEWSLDPVFTARIAEIKERRKRDFYEREACRRLVD